MEGGLVAQCLSWLTVCVVTSELTGRFGSHTYDRK